MSDDTDNIFVYLKEIPSEMSVAIVLFIILLCLCCFKDCCCSLWIDRRASNRLRRLENIQRETQEMETIHSLERRNSRINPPPCRGVNV